LKEGDLMTLISTTSTTTPAGRIRSRCAAMAKFLLQERRLLCGELWGSESPQGVLDELGSDAGSFLALGSALDALLVATGNAGLSLDTKTLATHAGYTVTANADGTATATK
jgi:hypothetical protein